MMRLDPRRYEPRRLAVADELIVAGSMFLVLGPARADELSRAVARVPPDAPPLLAEAVQAARELLAQPAGGPLAEPAAGAGDRLHRAITALSRAGAESRQGDLLAVGVAA